MLISDSFSDKTSSTLPIIISFSSHLKTRKIRKIRDFLQDHPNCQKYVTKGPNFVADGTNEFRLYYVDSSLYSDDLTLKKLNVEKEEIVFRSTSEDSLEPSQISLRKKECLDTNKTHRPEFNKIEKIDKGTICCMDSYLDLRCYQSVSESPQIMNKVSKSFQIGPDLRFNVVYVNTDIQYHSFNYNAIDASVQTEYHDVKSSPESSVKFPIASSPSFIVGSKSDKPERRKLTTFRNFCSKMEEKKTVCKITDDSEFSIESRTTSVKFSIKKSPSFVANYILEIINRRKSKGDLVKSEIYEHSIVNYVDYDDFKKRASTRRLYELENKNDITYPEMLKYDSKALKYDKKLHKEEMKKYKNEHHTHRKKAEKNKHDSKYTKNCNKIDKLHRYQNIGVKSNCYKVEYLFKCTNMDFFLRKSHYAILKKYHKKLKEKRHKHEHHHHHGNKHTKTDKKIMENKRNKNNEHHKNKYNNHNKKIVQNCQEVFHHKKNPTGDSRTRTTISGFLQSYRPWHWQDNSKLSVCIDEECFTEENYEEENTTIIGSPYQCEMFKSKKYFNL